MWKVLRLERVCIKKGFRGERTLPLIGPNGLGGEVGPLPTKERLRTESKIVTKEVCRLGGWGLCVVVSVVLV